MDRENVVNDLKSLREHYAFYRTELKTIDDALELLKEQESATVKAEIEGGGSSWWYVCSECHGAIDKKDQYCRHCGGRITE